MNLIEFIFLLVEKFVPIAPTKLMGMKNEATEWEQQTAKEPKGLMVYYHKFGQLWYVRLGLAVLFIFASRWVNDFMNPATDVDYEDED